MSSVHKHMLGSFDVLIVCLLSTVRSQMTVLFGKRWLVQVDFFMVYVDLFGSGDGVFRERVLGYDYQDS